MVSASGVYKRTPEALKEHAVLFWPRELSSGSPENEALSLLLETQDKFLGILLVADKKPTSWKQALVIVLPTLLTALAISNDTPP